MNYITLGADETGCVYGMELEAGGTWRRNPLGLSTSCAVIRPVSKEAYEYATEDAESVRELWQIAVREDQTELGLKDWFKEYVAYDNPLDDSWVDELLYDTDNPTIAAFKKSEEAASFKDFVEKAILESPDTDIGDDKDIYAWEASGWYPPEKPFVVEFAPHDVVETYYRHLEATDKKFTRNG